MKVTATTLNLRSGRGTEYNIIEKLEYGDLVEVEETTTSDWVYVLVYATGSYGYVHRNYIKKN